MTDRDHIAAGFLPLLDSAILVAAEEKGFARTEGIVLSLVRETSWANIRDRIAVGHFDVAHMLAPMAIASNLGLTPLPRSLVAPMALGLGGNAVTVSRALWREMEAAGAGSPHDAGKAGQALKAVIDGQRRSGAGRLQFAVVHPHSAHNLELRYWLAACGIDPERDIDITIVPPPLMSDALASGQIAGFCVGEPWNSVAVAAGAGRIVTVKAAIWRSSPEKVLGAREDWALSHGDVLARLLRALYRTAEWCGLPESHEELAAILARPDYLGQPPHLIRNALDGHLALDDDAWDRFADFYVPAAKAATFPWQSHALWFYSQMVRWGQVAHSHERAEIARRSYRPDLYRAALKPLGVPLPGANLKVEGALEQATPVGATRGKLVLGPDGFFDREVFDPDDLDAYIRAQSAGK